MYINILYLLVVALFITVLLLIKRVRLLEKRSKKVHETTKQLLEHYTSAMWFSEMLLNSEFGKQNFAQLELLHQINGSCTEGITLVNSLVTQYKKSPKEALPGSSTEKHTV